MPCSSPIPTDSSSNLFSCLKLRPKLLCRWASRLLSSVAAAIGTTSATMVQNVDAYLGRSTHCLSRL